MKIPNVDTVCPYCSVDRKKPATRQYRCKACGGTIYIKSTVDDPQKRLYTFGEAESIEEQWQEKWRIQKDNSDLERSGNTIKSMVCSSLISYSSHPDLNYFRIIVCADKPCAACAKLDNQLFRLNKHNIRNVPAPNLSCTNAKKKSFYCGSYVESVFDDQLAPIDELGAILKYEDSIEGSLTVKKITTLPAPNKVLETNKPNDGKVKYYSQDKAPTLKETNRKNFRALLVVFLPVILLCVYLWPASSSAPQVNQLKAVVDISPAIETYLKNNFGHLRATASWYWNIGYIDASGKNIAINASLKTYETIKATRVCNAVLGYLLENNIDFYTLRILAQSDIILASSRGAKSYCQ